MATYTNIDKWNKDFKRKFEETIKQTKETLALMAENKASELVPVLTGNLKGSISSGVDEKSVWVGAGFKNEVVYAKWIEYGLPIGGKTPVFKKVKGKTIQVRANPSGPRPFLRPAAWQTALKIPKVLEKTANRIYK